MKKKFNLKMKLASTLLVVGFVTTGYLNSTSAFSSKINYDTNAQFNAQNDINNLQLSVYKLENEPQHNQQNNKTLKEQNIIFDEKQNQKEVTELQKKENKEFNQILEQIGRIYQEILIKQKEILSSIEDNSYIEFSTDLDCEICKLKCTYYQNLISEYRKNIIEYKKLLQNSTNFDKIYTEQEHINKKFKEINTILEKLTKCAISKQHYKALRKLNNKIVDQQILIFQNIDSLQRISDNLNNLNLGKITNYSDQLNEQRQIIMNLEETFKKLKQ